MKYSEEMEDIMQLEREQNLAAYREALASGDKSLALELGRIYYASCNEDGLLTSVDEAALTNDLTAMGDAS